MREKDSLYAKLKINQMTKNKFNTMIEMLKYMDSDDKDKKTLSIKKPSSRNTSLTRQESRKEVKPTSSKSSLILNTNSTNSNPSPYDPRNLTSKNSTKKISTANNSSTKSNNSIKNDINNSYSMVDEHVQTVNE